MKFAAPLALTLLALSQAACSGPVVLPPPDRAMPTWSTMVYSAARGPILVEVKGRLFGGEAERLGRSIASAMNHQILAPPVFFTTDRAAAPVPDNKVVMLFGPALSATGAQLCAGQTPLGEADKAGRVRLIAAFCAGGTAFSSVEGWTDQAGSVESPQFRQLIGGATRHLFGNNDEERRQRDRPGRLFPD